MFRPVEAVSEFFARVTGTVVVILTAALVFSLLTSIFFRYVVGMALSWPEEISLILFTWMVLLATSLGVREGFHVHLSIVFERFPRGLKTVLQLAITLAICGFGVVMVYSGMDLIERTARHLTPTLRLPLDWINYSAPVSGALIVLHSIRRLFPQPVNED
jgi:TRAP-type C4-dicarboxylate transport system permease small subunit